MYAVIKTGGKQYRVAKGDTLKVELVPGDEGETITFGQVLLVTDGEKVTVGTPYVAGGKVTATVKGRGRAEKVKIVKFRRRKHYRKHMGHRQHFTEVVIDEIVAG